jgi:CelD/BcsL family acetyltransferase involved in cellulose biosynthesis
VSETRFADPPAASGLASRTATEPVGFQTIEQVSSFAQVASEWDGLVRAMPRPSPFLLHAWLLEWLRHYQGGARLAVQAAFRGGNLAAALPIVVQSRRGLRKARFVGGKQSHFADLLLAEGEDLSVATSLVARASSTFDFAELFGVTAESRLARVAGSRLHLFQRVESPVLDLGHDWDALYRAKISGKSRNLHRRRRRQLQEQGTLEFSFARTREQVDAALDDAFRIHRLRWEGRPDGSGFATPTGMAFHRAALGALSDQHVVHLVTMRLDGRAIAFLLNLAVGDRFYQYRLAFDPSFGRFSPGVLTLLETIEWAAGEGFTRFEFLGGAERYKVELADRFEPLHLAVGLPRGPAGRAVVAGRVGVLSLRMRMKRSATARRVYDATLPARRLLASPKDALR